MPIEVKDMVKFFGIDPEKYESIDAFKEDVNNTWMKKEEHDRAIGKAFGSIEVKAKNLAKEFGIGLDDIKELKSMDLIDEVTSRASKTYKTKMEELTKLSSGGDSALKEWQEKYTKLEKKHSETVSLIDGLKSEKEQIENQAKNTIKNFQIGRAKEEALSKLQLSKEVDEVKKRGFLSILDEEFDIDLDENNNPFVVDKKTKSRIKSDKKASEFLNISEAYEKKAAELKLLELKPEQGNNKPPVFNAFPNNNQNTNTNTNTSGRQRVVHPSLNK